MSDRIETTEAMRCTGCEGEIIEGVIYCVACSDKVASLHSALATARRGGLEALANRWVAIANDVGSKAWSSDNVTDVSRGYAIGLKTAAAELRALLSQSVEVGPTSSGTDSSEHFRALARAFDATDDKDWDHLFLMIPASGHGQFWMRVFSVVRKNLARIRQQESHCLQQHDHHAPAVGDKAGNHPIPAERSEAAPQLLSQSGKEKDG